MGAVRDEVDAVGDWALVEGALLVVVVALKCRRKSLRIHPSGRRHLRIHPKVARSSSTKCSADRKV